MTDAPAHHNVRPALHHQLVDIDQLDPHPRNARTRDHRAEAELRTSLETNGQYRAVVTRRLDDGRLQLLAGHGTTEQARDLGWTHIAAEVHDDVDDATAIRIVAVDNRTSDLAGYDPAREAELLEEIRRLNDDSLQGSGYDYDAELEVLERIAVDAGAGLTDPDHVPDQPYAEPRSRPGDTWLMGKGGRHRLTVGDATDPDVVACALDGQAADLLITDPPYNVNYTGGTAEQLTIAGDHQDDATFRAFLVDLFAAAEQHTRKGGPAYVFHADTERVNFELAFREAGWSMRQNLIWAKDRLVLGRQDHHWQHEPILYGWRPGASHRWYGGRTLTTLLDDAPDLRELGKDELVAMLAAILEEQSSVIREKRPTRNAEHPTMKPVHLVARLLERSSRRGGLALDVCAGSGPLLIAAHQTGRRASLVELEPRYADVICRRWEEHTGEAPVLEETGEAVSFVPEQEAAS